MATTIVNPTPQTTSDSGNGMGFLFGVILIILLVGLLLYFGLPYIRGGYAGSGGGGAQINVPSKFDINVKNSK